MNDPTPTRYSVAPTSVRHRGVVLALWALAAAFLLPASRNITQSLEIAGRVRGSESAAVEETLRDRFASPFGNWMALVVTGAPQPTTAEGRHLLGMLVDSVSHVPGVVRTLSYLDRPDTTFLGRDGGTVVVVAVDSGPQVAERLLPVLRAVSLQLRHALAARYPNLTLRWTGALAINDDIRHTSSGDIAAAEARALPVTLVLLLLAFGALGAALLSILAGVFAIGIALGLAALLAHLGHPTILLVNVVTMIGLGLAIDYALLIISRFREAVAAGQDRAAAASDAALHGGHTIAISGLAVVIGFGALLGIKLNELRSVAIGGVVVTLISVLVGATLMPAVLSWIGGWIEVGRVRRLRAAAPSARWETWGAFVTRNPGRVLLVASLPVVALALQALRLRTDVEAQDWLPPAMESAQGLQDLRAMGRSAVIASMPVIVDLPDGSLPYGKSGWNGVRRLGDWMTRQPGVAGVRSLPVLAGGGPWRLGIILHVPPDARRAFVSRDHRAVTLDVLPDEHADRHDLANLVRRVRATDPAALTGLNGARVRIGGIAAFQVDYGDAVKHRFWSVVSLAIACTLLALFVGFRSVLVPLKAVALNLLSVIAALGVVVLVFQDGHGVRLLGVDRPLGGVFSSVPALVFCVVFGLSMDYEVFLVARVREAHRRGSDPRAALVEGLGRTANLITSAAAIMIAVFAAFALGRFVLVKMLGVALATAVALDATLVRLAIGPALLCLAGRWNWWPGGSARPPSQEER